MCLLVDEGAAPQRKAKQQEEARFIMPSTLQKYQPRNPP